MCTSYGQAAQSKITTFICEHKRQVSCLSMDLRDHQTFWRGVSTWICLEWSMVSQAITRTDTADPASRRRRDSRQGIPVQECAEAPRTGRHSRRMEPVSEEHLGASTQRCYGPEPRTGSWYCRGGLSPWQACLARWPGRWAGAGEGRAMP